MTVLQQERDQLYIDLWNDQRPKRVPIQMDTSIEFALEYFGYSLLRDLYSPEKCIYVAEEMAKLIEGDTLPTRPFTSAAVFRYIKAKFMVPGDDGFFQHPNISPMQDDEYPEFIKDPLSFIVNKIQPRVFGILEDDPKLGQVKINIARSVVASKFIGVGERLAEKYERSTVQAMSLLIWAPFDFLADYIRNFSSVLIDIRRNPSGVLDACEAILKYELEQVDMLPKPRDGTIPIVTLPLHMAPFMKPKDFEKFYWPTFKKLIAGIQERGYKASIYCEQNWDAHLDALNDLPGKVQIGFESSDPKLVAQKVTTRHMFSHFYPTGVLRNGTKEECIDKAKEILDILAPGGNYIFTANKVFLRASDVVMDNVQAVVEFVNEYGKY